MRVLVCVACLVLSAALISCESAAPGGGSTDEAAWAPSAEPCGDAGGFGSCELADWPGRDYIAYLPTTVDRTKPTPVVMMLHGGTGRAAGAILTTCPDGDTKNPACLHEVAEREGFVVVYPNGTGEPATPNQRTWNAGGGGATGDGPDQITWHCVGGYACENNIDDVAYFNDLLDDLESWLNVDEGAVFATGLSNGAAMVHRLACELSDRIAAIASVGGGNQYATTASCSPATPVAILHLHGAADPCWTYDQTNQSCGGAPVDTRIGAEESSQAWADRYGAKPAPTVSTEPDTDGDGEGIEVRTWTGGAARVVLLRDEGAGHTWPDGNQYMDETVIGPVSRDTDSDRLWEFFDAHRR